MQVLVIAALMAKLFPAARAAWQEGNISLSEEQSERLVFCAASLTDNCKLMGGVCCDHSMTCFEKNSELASCMHSCQKGISHNDPPAFRTPWTCRTGNAILPTTTTLPLGPVVPFAPVDHALSQPSSAQVFSFHMYRAESDSPYGLENVNTGNLAGTMWYLQNEIFSGTWGWDSQGVRFGISRIVRYMVHTKATKPLIAAGMNFGARLAFDGGRCTGPQCDLSKDTYGYYVGCNNLPGYPFPKFETHYRNAVWYSLPGPCFSRPFNKRTPGCEIAEPGGHCQGIPTGTGSCTYSYSEAGQVSLAEIYAASGKDMESFWKHWDSEAVNQQRVELVQKLFAKKYGPDQPAPVCDFDLTKFGIQ